MERDQSVARIVNVHRRMNPYPAATAFARKLETALRGHSPAGRYLVGVSGGRDSVALLHGLVAAGFRRLVVCHLDHGLRGEASAEDARFVGRLAGTLDLPFEQEAADVAAMARRAKCSLETAARDARYAFFFAVAAKRRCRTVFLAHHADDQAETFLFNLLRGAGPAGLGAMAAETVRTVGRRKLRVLRPLLAVWRAEIDAYLQAHGLRWREDATNADPAHATRNRLRAEVLPLLESAMGRDVRPALWRAADILRAEENWLASLSTDDEPFPLRLPVKNLAAQSLARQRRLLRGWLRARGVPGVGYEEIERVRSLLDPASGPAKVNLPGGRHARRRAGVLFVEAPGVSSDRRALPGK